MAMDVTDEAQIRAVVDRIVRDHGRVDVLVNNAGVSTFEHRVPIDQFPRDEWDRLLDVDLTGLYLVSKTVGGLMRSQGSGRIVNIASIVGLVPLRLQCAFVAAKAGVINLTRKRRSSEFTDSDRKLVSAVAATTATQIHNCRLINAERERQRLEHELELAARIQLSLLPEEPLSVGGLELGELDGVVPLGDSDGGGEVANRSGV